jgi:hypothetical protein
MSATQTVLFVCLHDTEQSSSTSLPARRLPTGRASLEVPRD